jgi:glyoxylase-like metal-dependent hydrolase (beta-lactamase superfamily II)
VRGGRRDVRSRGRSAARDLLSLRTLVNTHHHPDHTAGNGLFGGVAIVAHEKARPEMRALGLPHNSGVWTDVDYGDLELALPFPLTCLA